MNWKDPRISAIIKMELELTQAIYQGHRPKENDRFQDIRNKLKRLREELGIKSHQSAAKVKVQAKG
jgi:hypothetical protein